ncbi:MAG: MoaD/ThiS family protein [Deltaproteobacteria bacterium]|nr:MoaD/ThiS family protein [Deltaproteobacteria bacterium]
MGRVTVELWLWLGRHLGEDFEPLSDMRSVRDEEVPDGTTVGQMLENLAQRYQAIAERVFDLQSGKIRPEVVVNYNDRVANPHTVQGIALKEGDKITILPLYVGGSSQAEGPSSRTRPAG